MRFKANEQQQEAIETFDCNLLVSAGAGTGKTRVLAEKYLKLLQDRTLSINEIVAITFTDKAAAEMRSRIREDIEECLKNAPSEDKDYWKKQLELSEQARIMTFHSFCSSLIREYPLEAGFQPGATILDGGEFGVVLKKIIANAVLDITKENRIDFLEIYPLHKLIAMFREIYLKIKESGLSFAEVMQLSRESLGDFDPEIAPKQITEVIIAVESFIMEFSEQKLTTSSATKIKNLKNEFPNIKVKLKAPNVELTQILATFKQLVEFLKGPWPAIVKDEACNLKETLEHATVELIDNQSLLMLPLFQELFEKIDVAYRQFKLEYGFIDFLDMQLLARDMLRNNESLAAEIRRGIGYLMVDEFQDTNTLQMELINILLASEQCHWMAVGDVKQSIYRFRGADAGIIVDLRQDFEKRGDKIVPLIVNYRSQSPIIDYVNAVCERIFQSENFPYESLEAGQKLTQTDSGIEFLMTAEDNALPQAELAANRICSLVAEGRYGYKDIVLLFRSTTDMEPFQKVFQNFGIPYNMTGGSNFYERIEIKDQLNFLQALENPQDEVLILAVLTSPFVGLSESVLVQLLSENSLSSLIQETAITNLISDSTQLQRFYRFREIIQKLRRNISEMTVADILRYVLNNSDYLELTRLFSDGEQREANIMKLLSIATAFSVKGHHNINEFIEYLEELQNDGAKESNASVQGDGNNAVRMLTIHASKGLEFPVVILPRLIKSVFQSNPEKNTMLFHKLYGLAFQLLCSDGEVYESSLYKKIKELAKYEELSESKRLFYVAMTRAKQHLILLGSDYHLLKSDKDTDINTANSWLRWLRIVHEIPTDADNFSFAGLTIKVTREISNDLNAVSSRLLLDEPSNSGNSSEIRELPLPGPPSTSVILSPSMVMCYNKCPRYFFLRCGYNLPEIFGDNILANDDSESELEHHDGLGAIIGTFFHFIAEKGFDAWPDDAWREFLDTHDIPEPLKLESEIKQMWHNYLHSEYAADSNKCHDELPFSMEVVPGLEMEGRMDRLIENEQGELILVDYKTHRIEGEQVDTIAKKYFPQLQLYSLAIQKMWGRLPNRADLFFAYAGISVSVPLDEMSLESLKEKLKKLGGILANEHNHQAYETADNCSNCGYTWFCHPKK